MLGESPGDHSDGLAVPGWSVKTQVLVVETLHSLWRWEAEDSAWCLGQTPFLCEQHSRRSWDMDKSLSGHPWGTASHQRAVFALGEKRQVNNCWRLV